MKDAIGQLAAPLRALVVAVSGVVLAWQWLQGDEILALLPVAGIFLFGMIADSVGRAWLPKYPRASVRALEWWILVPGALGAAAAAAVIVLTVELTVPDDTATQTKETVGALATGITSFLSTAFVAWAGDEKDSRLADRIKAAFFRAYKRPDGAPDAHVHYFRPESDGERWVYSEDFKGASGWGRPDRLVRAKGIAEELASGRSDA